MESSKTNINAMRYNQNEKKAFEKGYRITDEGKVIGLRGEEIGFTQTNGYPTFKVRDIKNKKLNVSSHRLQAYQKFGDKIYEDGIVVRHLDGDKHNNSVDNIEIGSYSDNYMDQPEHVRVARAKHAASFVKKYNDAEVIDFYNECNSYQKTMDEFNISSKGTLHYILKKNPKNYKNYEEI